MGPPMILKDPRCRSLILNLICQGTISVTLFPLKFETQTLPEPSTAIPKEPSKPVVPPEKLTAVGPPPGTPPADNPPPEVPPPNDAPRKPTTLSGRHSRENNPTKDKSRLSDHGNPSFGPSIKSLSSGWEIAMVYRKSHCSQNFSLPQRMLGWIG